MGDFPASHLWWPDGRSLWMSQLDFQKHWIFDMVQFLSKRGSAPRCTAAVTNTWPSIIDVISSCLLFLHRKMSFSVSASNPPESIVNRRIDSGFAMICSYIYYTHLYTPWNPNKSRNTCRTSLRKNTAQAVSPACSTHCGCLWCHAAVSASCCCDIVILLQDIASNILALFEVTWRHAPTGLAR